MATIVKDVKLDLRLSNETKKMIEQAASLSGISTSAYIMAHVFKAARKDIARFEHYTITDVDRDRFLSALENPPEPNDTMKKAVEKYKQSYIGKKN